MQYNTSSGKRDFGVSAGCQPAVQAGWWPMSRVQTNPSEQDVVCNICGALHAEETYEIGSSRGESGSIGMGVCGTCWEAAKWHSNHKQKYRCFNCREEHAKKLILYRPQGERFELNLCRDCLPGGGVMHMFESDVGFRARANVERTWNESRRMALARDNHRCQSCGVGDCRLHVHHILPRSEGGTDHRENLMTLCPECHAEEHGKSACDLCGTLTEKGGTWIDSSGGSWINTCEDCMSYIQRNGKDSERCSICARFCDEHSKSNGVYFGLTEGGTDLYAACDECRRNVIFESWQTRQEYIDKQLPDSHVDVRHWEAGND